MLESRNAFAAPLIWRGLRVKHCCEHTEGEHEQARAHSHADILEAFMRYHHMSFSSINEQEISVTFPGLPSHLSSR
jgi:hypothetical protein